MEAAHAGVDLSCGKDGATLLVSEFHMYDAALIKGLHVTLLSNQTHQLQGHPPNHLMWWRLF